MSIKVSSIFTVILITGGVFVQAALGASGEHREKPIRVLLLGASVGEVWNLPGWPVRMQNNDYAMEMIAEYSFDKSRAIEEVLMRPRRKLRLTRTYLKGFFKPSPQKPDILIIKECAAYFPGNFEEYKKIVDRWVKQCKAAAIKPIVATVVPVTTEHGQKQPGRLEGILQYNDWIRSYARENSIGVLDLELALRVKDNDRSLRPDLTDGDGLHLNKQAYDILDKMLGDQLKGWLQHP